MLLPTITVVFTTLLLIYSIFREDILHIFKSAQRIPVCNEESSISKQLPIKHVLQVVDDHNDSYDHQVYNSSFPDSVYKCQLGDKEIYISNRLGTTQCLLDCKIKKANAEQSEATTVTSLCVHKSEPILTEANSLMLFIALISVVVIYAFVSNTCKRYEDFCKKQKNVVNEVEGEVATLLKTKNNLEVDLHQVRAELVHTKTQAKENEQSMFILSRKLAKMEEELEEASAKIAEFEVSVSALQLSESKLQCQNRDISMQLEEAERRNDSLSLINSNMSSKLNEIKSELEIEVKTNSKISSSQKEARSELKMEVTDKLKAQSNLRSAEAYRDKLQVLLNEEREDKGVLSEKLEAAISEASMWKTKFEGEAFSKIEELEDTNHKLQKELKDTDASYKALQNSHSNQEKAKNLILAELKDLKLDLEMEHMKCQSLEKKKKQIDKQVTDWKLMYDSKEAELDQSKNLLCLSGTEGMEMRNQFENMEEVLAAAQKEEKRLQSELSYMEKQIDKEGLTTQELEKAKNKLEADNEELTINMEEIEAQLVSKEVELKRVQLELMQEKSETDQQRKEMVEVESTKKNLQRQLVALQEALGLELKTKNDEAKQRKLMEEELKKVQAYIAEVEKALNDTLKKHRTSAGHLKELNTLYEWERKLCEEQREISAKTEKRAYDLKEEVEDLLAQMEQLQRSYNKCDAEKVDATECVQELQASISMLHTAKDNVEQSMAAIQEEYKELEIELKESKQKLKYVVEQNGHLQSGTLVDKDKIHALLKTKSSLEVQIKEISSRMDIDKANATKAAKMDAAKIQAKILELENEIIDEAKSKIEMQRALKKTDNQMKELQRQLDMEKSSSHILQDQTNMLKRKVRNLRTEKEEEETEKNILMKRLKQSKAEAEDSEETCTMLRAQVYKLRKNSMRNTSPDVYDDEDAESLSSLTDREST